MGTQAGGPKAGGPKAGGPKAGGATGAHPTGPASFPELTVAYIQLQYFGDCRNYPRSYRPNSQPPDILVTSLL